MPKRSKFENVKDVEKDYKETCKGLKGTGFCLNPRRFVEDTESKSVTKKDRKTLEQWLVSKGENVDVCGTT